MSTIIPCIESELLTKFNEIYKELTYNIRVNLAFQHKVPIENITSIQFKSSVRDNYLSYIDYCYTSKQGNHYTNGASGNSLALLTMKPDITILSAMNTITTQKKAIQLELRNLESENQSLDLKYIADRKIEIRKNQEYLQKQLEGINVEEQKLFDQITVLEQEIKRSNETD